MNQASGSDPFMAFLPITLLGLIAAAFTFFIARRKGANPVLYCILAIIPLVQLYALLVLASKTDKAVLDRLEALETTSRFS